MTVCDSLRLRKIMKPSRVKNMDIYCQASCEAGSESRGSCCIEQDSRIAPM
jgi:hypothetical protein